MTENSPCFDGVLDGLLTNFKWSHACRNFTARREHCSSTWINRFGVFLHTYGSADSNSAGVLSTDECSAIPDPAKCAVDLFALLSPTGGLVKERQPCRT